MTDGLDRIELRGLRVPGQHGVLPDERRDGQDFLIDAVLHVDTRTAGESDDLAATIDYGTLAMALADDVARDPLDLIEALAARLAQRCLADPRVATVELTVHKPQAPIPLPFDDVAVRIVRHQGRVDS